MSKEILVVAELKGKAPKAVTFEMLNAARVLAAENGGGVSAVAVGEDPAGIGEMLGAHGATRVFIADMGKIADPETAVAVLSDLIRAEEPFAVLIGATSRGRDLAPRLAARLDAGLVSDAVGLRIEGDRLIAKRPVFAGKAFNEVAALTTPGIATVRPNVLPRGTPEGPPAQEIGLPVQSVPSKTEIIDTVAPISDRPDLTEADRIVSGGRGLKSKENFAVLESLADVLGATIGASRAAVDAGYADGSCQVGQTGKVVNPSLYIACGIAGAIQHQAGMRTSKTIVAINKDEKAPIFKIADYGIVADLFDAVPLLTEVLRKTL